MKANVNNDEMKNDDIWKWYIMWREMKNDIWKWSCYVKKYNVKVTS